jgi:fatty acid desaturase
LPLTVLIAAPLIGYTIHFVQHFFHEAAHYLLAPDRAWNDRLANLFVGAMVGQDIRGYRIIHFDHHRHLGTPEDTERSYFNALRVRFMLEALTGVLILRVVLRRIRHVDARAATGKAADSSDALHSQRLFMLIAGLLLNLALLGFAVWVGAYSFALAWPFGMFVIFPAVNSVRQLLEHRSFEARSNVDYTREAHGALTRLFDSGPIASTLGGAGFNRHLLHHWEPQLSYTRFAELEAFLLETSAAEIVRSSKTTYARAFVTLLRAR